jgi:uncharacterized protein (TIGR03066 family)
MKSQRVFVLSALFSLVFVVFGGAAHAADLKKVIVGKWQPAEEKNAVIEFTPDGKLHVKISDPPGKEKPHLIDGSYKWLDASTVEATLTEEGESIVEKLTVSIDGDTMSTIDSKGKKEKFSRVK